MFLYVIMGGEAPMERLPALADQRSAGPVGEGSLSIGLRPPLSRTKTHLYMNHPNKKCLCYYKPISMPNATNNDSDVSDTLRTTPSERKKAQLIKRCVINFLKCWRMCKKTSKDTKPAN